jgi:hypothetical protein
MEFVIIAVAALVVSALTMFSGFGLGTLLMPVFAIFFPIEAAIAATAVVHGANGVLKAALLGREADRSVVLRFGIPALLSAFAGAAVLGAVSTLDPLFTYTLAGRDATVTPIKLVMGILMTGFALFELLPRFANLEFDRRWLPLGGVLSGFFGGLSGHQGALRSAFLVKSGLSPKAFVGSNAVIGLMVDVARLSVYGAVFLGQTTGTLFQGRTGGMILAGVMAAFTGVVVGKRILPKVTMASIQVITGVMLLVIALALGMGVI